VLPWLSATAQLRVESIYRRALNLALADGSIVAVLSAPAGRVPNGIHLDEPVDFTAQPIEVGRDAVVRDGLIVLSGDAMLDLRWAPPWSLQVEPIPPAPMARLADNREHARVRMPRDPVLTARARELTRALAAGEPETIGRTVDGLVGLGPGLTPAGDDLLLGLACLLQSADHPTAAPLGAAIAAGADRTTPLSATLLRLAAAGHHAELTARLCAALLAGDRLDVDAELAALIGRGGRSCGETARGAILGLGVLLRA
jgi:hypothetical protein